MVVGVKSPSRYPAPGSHTLGPAIGSSADHSVPFSTETIMQPQAVERTPRTAVVPDPLFMDSFAHTFPHISELNVGSLFTVQNLKKSQAPVLLSGSPKSGAVVRSAPPKGPSLVGGFEQESSSLSSFDLEYILLEQALKKDGNNAAPAEPQIPTERKPIHNILEPEFYFSDILGDNGIPPHSLETGQGGLYNSADVPNDKSLLEGNHMQMDADFSNALAGLVGSDVSAEFSEDIGSARLKDQFISRAAHRDGLDAAHERLYGRSIAGSSFHGNVKAFRDLKNISVGRIGKHRKRYAKDSILNHCEKDQFTLLKTADCEDEPKVQSPLSNSSVSGGCNNIGIGSHPDLYENLSGDIREKVDRLQGIISAMPRRKLRESLAQGVSIDDVEPLMCVNRDELAAMLGLGVTTWKMFVHHTLGIPRWPARALKSQKVKETKLIQKIHEAEQREEYDVADRLRRELHKLIQTHLRRRKLFRDDVKHKISHGAIKKGN